MSDGPNSKGVDHPELDVAIGSFFRAWTLLEHSLQMYLACLLITDQWRAKIVWKNAGGMTSRLRLLKDLVANFVEGTEKKLVLKHISELQKNDGLVAIRNTLAHCGLYLHRDGKTVQYSSPEISRDDGHAVFYESKNFPLKNLKKWELEVNKMTADFGARGNLLGKENKLSIERKPSILRRP